MASITLLSSITGGNTNISSVTISLGTNSATRLIILTLTVTGTSAINVTPTYAGNSFVKAGATVATSEGNVEIWYMTTDTESKSGFVSYNNKGGLYHVPNVYTFQSSEQIDFHSYQSSVSISGSTANISTSLGTNTGSVVLNQWHSGYYTLSGVSKNGTLLHQLDRGNLINGSAYSVSTSATSQNLYWSTPSADDYAMAQVAFLTAAAPPATGDITSRNSIAFDDMTSVNLVNLSDLGEINSIDTGN